MEFDETIHSFIDKGMLTPKLGECLQKFYLSYREALEKNDKEIDLYRPIFNQFLELVLKEIEHPYKFEAYHQRITTPVDYYKFGLDLIRPLIIFEQSRVHHIKQLDTIIEQISQGDNVILFANHQTEPDPQAIALLLEKTHRKFAEEMIFVAGDRVISDPLAIPFSMGCNLLCIYSKKHIENPPEKKTEKLLHNKRTMQNLSALLSEGGKTIYVAPSGGRDRINLEGVIEVAPFDPQSIEMFRLMAQQSQRPCHFYPLALATYSLLPPPSSVEKELGERRHTQCTPIHMSFGKEIDMQNFPGNKTTDKHELRKIRAQYIWNLVLEEYLQLV